MPDPRGYRRLAALLRDQIISGMPAPGGPMPSIGELHHKHGHSRQTVGKATRILQDEGLIYRVPGLGYYRTEDLQDRAGIQPPGCRHLHPGRRPLRARP